MRSQKDKRRKISFCARFYILYMASKKFIKKLLRHPNRAKCPECGYKMTKKIFEDEDGTKKLFVCSNLDCLETIDVSDYYLSANGKYHKQKRDEEDYWWPQREEETDKPQKEMIFVLNRFKLGDKMYKIDDNTEYNPTTRELLIKSIGTPEVITNEVKHCDLIEKIQLILNNAKTTNTSNIQ